MTNSVRTYPRTTRDAFRNTCEHACAIERPARITWAERCVKLALWLSVVAIVVSVLFQGPL